jgi:RNA polymerase sigma-70 factor, ECF subfamily
MDLREAAQRARQGDRGAFGALILAEKESYYRIAYSYVKNKEDALDIVADAVCKAYASIRSLKQPEYFNTWFTRILINCAIDHQKKAKRRLPLPENLMSPQIKAPDPVEHLDLYAAMDKLEKRQKTVIILKYLHGLTLVEVADILKCPVGTVKTTLHKALTALRQELREDT